LEGHALKSRGHVFSSKNLRDAAIPYKGFVKHIKSLHVITIHFLKAFTAQSAIEIQHFDNLDCEGAQLNFAGSVPAASKINFAGPKIWDVKTDAATSKN
jgi:hypothetical protein